MTHNEFLQEASNIVFKEVAKNVNLLTGLSKTSSMIVNLLVTLPLQVEVRKISGKAKPSKKLNALGEFVHVYLKHDNSTMVHIAFFYGNETQFPRILKAINKHPEFFAYLYMREALKLTRNMNTKTHYKMMSGIIKHNNPSIPVQMHYKYSIKACDYVVNDMIRNLFLKAKKISNKISSILEEQAYSGEYSGKSEMEVLVDIIKTADVSESVPVDDEFLYDEDTHQLLTPGNVNGSSDIDESIQTDLGEAVASRFYSMSRGSGSAALFGDFFTAKKVKTGWFKQLANKFESDVFYMTNTFTSEWSSLNITYRHKFKAPKAKYKDNKLSVVLSVDHSASVSTEGLQKLLYLFEKQGKKITQLIVLIHDTEVVKEFILEDNFDISSNPNFKEALAHRFAVGGTSHKDVFCRINSLLENKVIDPEKTIYIAFSDFYSDVPESIKAHPMIKTLNPIWLSPIDNPLPDSCGGINISMQ